MRRDIHRRNPGARVGALAGLILVAGLTASGVSRGQAIADDGPPPPSDPREISGVWFGTGFFDPVNRSYKPMEGGDPPFTPAGLAIYTERRAADKAGHPVRHDEATCVPNGFPGSQEGAPFDIIQAKGVIGFVSEANHVINIVHMDKDHPKNLSPTFLGHSVGHWEGDTLIIDTVGFRPDRWLDYTGTPSSDELHVVEHLKKVTTPGGKVVLENIVTIIDPKDYTKPWNVRRIFLWRPKERVNEEICEENGSQLEPGDPNAGGDGKAN